MIYKFIIVSANNEFQMSKTETEDISSKNSNIIFEYISNNDKSLAEVYNQYLNVDNSNIDYLCFLHADVRLNILSLVKKIETCKDKYDIMGLCGCSKISVSKSPLNWYTGSSDFPTERWGCVSHGEFNNQKTFFNYHMPHVTDHAAACIDGLCIIFSKTAINSGLRFDENLGKYSFYDTDISFQAVIHKKLRLGVLILTDLYHFSVGKSILSEQFIEDEKKFRKKWNF